MLDINAKEKKTLASLRRQEGNLLDYLITTGEIQSLENTRRNGEKRKSYRRWVTVTTQPM